MSTIQYFLNFIGNFTNNIQPPAVDGIFGQGTYNSVVQFQRQYGRTALSGATHGTSCRLYIMISCEPSPVNFQSMINMRVLHIPATICSAAARAVQ